MKASCLAFASFVVLVAPAAATEAIPPTANGLQTGAAATASLGTLLQQITSEDAGSPIATDPADAEFVAKLRAMLALAKDEMHRAAAGPNPVRIDVHLRCVATRTVVVSEARPSSFVPALEWSAVGVDSDATQATAPAASKVVRACAFRLLRRDGVAEHAPQMQPYAVELPVVLDQQSR